MMIVPRNERNDTVSLSPSSSIPSSSSLSCRRLAFVTATWISSRKNNSSPSALCQRKQQHQQQRHHPQLRRFFHQSSPLSTTKNRHNSTAITCTASPSMEIKIGDRVRVLDKGITMFHFPGKTNVAVEVAGMTGKVIKDVSIQGGVKVSCTAPYVVSLDEYPKAKCHFAENELEVISPTDENDDDSTSS